MRALLATISLAALSSTAFAAPTNFPIKSGELTRAEVRAAIDEPSHLIDHGEVIDFTIPAGQRTRAEVRAELEADRASRSYGGSNPQQLAGDRSLFVGG